MTEVPGGERPAAAAPWGDPTAPAGGAGDGGDWLPAATVALVRDAPAGPEVLVLHRSSRVAFGGAWVFPGGRVDPGDADPDAPEDELAAARRAAVREAAEEAAVVVPADRLVPLSLWVPPPQAPRRYRTWFFVAPGPFTEVAVDGSEIEDHAWLAPAEVLARHAAGDVELVPPTWMTLWSLAADAAGGAAADVVAAVARRSPEHFATRMAGDGHRVAALWQGDAGYVDGSLDAPGPRRRLWLAPGPWRLEWPVRQAGAGGLSSA